MPPINILADIAILKVSQISMSLIVALEELILSNEWIQNTYYIFAKCTHVYFVSRPINCTIILIETTERLIVWLSLVPFRFGLV